MSNGLLDVVLSPLLSILITALDGILRFDGVHHALDLLLLVHISLQGISELDISAEIIKTDTIEIMVCLDHQVAEFEDDFCILREELD